MDNLFLPREIGSIETGSQIFAETSTPNTTFYFFKEIEEPGLLNNILVSNGGYNDLNGTFVYTTEFEDRPYYNKDGNGNWFIVWFNNQWGIYDFSEDDLDPLYYSAENRLYPWNVKFWQAKPGYEPAPTVTKVL